MKINVKMKLLSPLCHFSDEREGTMQLHRNMKFNVNNSIEDIPIFTGNAFRGELRRIAMQDYLTHINIIDNGITAKLFYTLYSGGALTSGSRYSKIGEKQNIRKMCPPLALWGTALGDQILRGKLKVGIFKPICKETIEYTGIESDISFWDLLEENFYTRHDDLKSDDYNIKGEEKFDNAVQMKYEMQSLCAGTILCGNIVLENCNEIELSCFQSVLNRFKENSFIGGKSATGHGEVKLILNDFADENIYYNCLKENKETIQAWLRQLESDIK